MGVALPHGILIVICIGVEFGWSGVLGYLAWFLVLTGWCWNSVFMTMGEAITTRLVGALLLIFFATCLYFFVDVFVESSEYLVVKRAIEKLLPDDSPEGSDRVPAEQGPQAGRDR